MSWNTKGPELTARPFWADTGRRVLQVENLGDAPALEARCELVTAAGRQARPQWIRGALPAELAPGATVSLRLSTAIAEDCIVVLTWRGATGDERRWHGVVGR